MPQFGNRGKFYRTLARIYGAFIHCRLYPITVLGAEPESMSEMSYFADAIMTFVPLKTQGFIYSSFADAPFEPMREVPLQRYFASSMRLIVSSFVLPQILFMSEPLSPTS